jgi:hypothetical protein
MGGVGGGVGGPVTDDPEDKEDYMRGEYVYGESELSHIFFINPFQRGG